MELKCSAKAQSGSTSTESAFCLCWPLSDHTSHGPLFGYLVLSADPCSALYISSPGLQADPSIP